MNIRQRKRNLMWKPFYRFQCGNAYLYGGPETGGKYRVFTYSDRRIA